MRFAISANRLLDGIVVFFGSNNHWVDQLSAAFLYTSKDEAEAALVVARLDQTRNVVVEPYVFEVRAEGTSVAHHIREAIRAAGPTVRKDHGKQADLLADKR